MFIIKLLAQHVSDIIMPIIRRTRSCITAYGFLHWLCWLWLCGAGSLVVRRVKVTVRTVPFTRRTHLTTQLHTTTASTTSAEHNMQ